MTMVATRIVVSADGTISGRAPSMVRPGEHEALIALPDLQARQPAELPLDVDDLPCRDLGAWPVGMSLRREDFYDGER